MPPPAASGSAGSATADAPQPSPFTRANVIAAAGDVLKKAFPLPAYRALTESLLGFHVKDVATNAAAGDLF
eukprot:11220490-Lingulodinium_polyedra.AAC.1